MDFKYNGVDITTIAPVKIDDIRVSPIQYAPVVRPRAFLFGSEFVRMRGGVRTVDVTFALQDNNQTTRFASLAALSEWAKTDKEYKIEFPFDSRVLYGVCTMKPEPSVRQWWENKLRFVFTCFDNPYWTDDAETTVACGTEMTITGDAPPLMRIERTLSAAASNQSYSDGTNTMTFSTIPAGNMVIDLNRQTAAVGGTSFMQYFSPASKFPVPKTGTLTISGTGNVKYRKRWE